MSAAPRSLWGISVAAAVILSLLHPTSAIAVSEPPPAASVTPSAVAPSVPTNLDDRVSGIIVAYEPGVARLDAQGAPTGTNAMGGVDVTGSAALGDGMSNLTLSQPVDQVTAKALAAKLTADPRIKWAAPNGWKKPVRDTASTVTPAVDVTVNSSDGSATKSAAFTYVDIPVVTSVAPTAGAIAGGKTVTLTGTNLANISAVTFGGSNATIRSATATSVVVVTPAHSAGVVSISASGSNGSVTKATAFTFAGVPTISALSVRNGPVSGGTTTVVSGTNLATASAVTFGGTAGTVLSATATSVTVKSPAKTVGIVTVAVTTAGGAVSRTNAFTFLALPTLATVTPASGSTAGGKTVTLAGTNLATITAVSFGSIRATIASKTATRVVVVTPAHSAGYVPITVSGTNGSVTKAAAYRFVYGATSAAVVTRSAFYKLGSKVALQTKATNVESQFAASGALAGPLADCGYTDAVYLVQRCYDDSNYDAGYYAFDSEIVFSDVKITTANKTNMVINVVPYVAISDSSWLTNPANVNKVVFDTNSDGIPDVAITDQNQVLASGQTGSGWVYDWDATNLGWIKRSSTCSTTISWVVSGAAGWWQYQTDWTCLFGTDSGASNVKAMAYLEDVNGYDFSPDAFSGSDSMNLSATLAPLPTISTVAPNAGPNSGGTSVTITGTELANTSTVTIGGVAAQITAQTATTVTATTARTSVVGLTAVAVTTPSGTTTADNAFTFSSSAPVITSVSPNSGPRTGGTAITITGLNLSGVTSVQIGSGLGTITASSATSLTVTVPAEAAPFTPLVPTETSYTNGTLWGLTGTYGVGAVAAWAKTQGSPNVIVAVVDTGITVHSDLGRQVAGYDMVSLNDTNNDGVGDQPYMANDGNGRDSNPADPGDWVSASEANGSVDGGFFSGCPEDGSSWHGTHVAGTINAAINGFGSVGLAPNVTVEPVRVLGKCGGYDSDILDGILWAAGGTVPGVPVNQHPANVISLSLGGSGACEAPMQAAIDYAWSHNVVVTIAAGNSNVDSSDSSPGNCNHVITVAATDSSGKRATFSNYGAGVEIAAPGVGIYSTLNSGATSPSTETYASYSGTSMATPHVAAVVALILSREPLLTPAQVLTRLQSTATSFGGGVCDADATKTCGAGIANAGAAVH